MGGCGASYQRRSDLIGNLVETVKGEAKFEKETLVAVIDARSKATSIQLTADQITPENMAKFQEAQAQLSGALSRLLVVSEQYPALKATQAFSDLMNELEQRLQRCGASLQYTNTLFPRKHYGWNF